MTLVVTLVNRDQAIIVADRRLSAAGREVGVSGKCGVLFCANAKAVFGYTGLARLGSFDTFRWLCEQLSDSGDPDYTLGGITKRLKERATKLFRENRAISRLGPADRSLTILFSGYLLNTAPPRIGSVIVSNAYDAPMNLRPAPSENFEWYERVEIREAGRDPPDAPFALTPVGTTAAIPMTDYLATIQMLRERRPAEALVAKVVSLLQAASSSPKAGGTVGGKVSWLSLPSGSSGAQAGYETDGHSSTTVFPAFVVVTPDQRSIVFEGELGAEDDSALVVPNSHRHSPCPCGSRKRYKSCHGKREVGGLSS